MASSTAQTEYARMLRRKNAGTKARRARENKGTTPIFAVHGTDGPVYSSEQDIDHVTGKVKA
jgi:hypothetical protein